MLNRDSHEALYVQLANELTRQIADGVYQARDRLPTEQQLMLKYGVSRVTVRQALHALKERGLLFGRPAKGTFVAGPIVKQDLAVLGGFYDALVAQGIQPTMRLVDYRLVRCPPNVRARLHHHTATLLVRQHTVQRTPIAVAYTHLHPWSQRIPRERAEVNPSYRILADLLGFSIGWADLAIRAGHAQRAPAHLLGVRRGVPVLILERTTFEPSGEPLEHTLFYLRSDAYEFGLTVRGPAPLTGRIRAAASSIPQTPGVR